MIQISSDIIRGYNDTMILYLLLNKPSYGYEISKQIKELSGEKNGYVESFSDQDNTAGKRRTYYRITELGRQYYREKCEEWMLTQEVVEKFIMKQ